MRGIVTFIGGLALVGGLAAAGDAATAALHLPVPGAVLGLLAYLALLATGRGEWSTGGARWLAGLLGALIVPPLVGVAAFAPVLAAGGWRLGLALVAGVVVTGLITAASFRLFVGAATR